MPSAIIPFGGFEPDKAQHGHQGLTRADNVRPIANGYAPVGAFQAATAALSGWSGGDAFVGTDGASILLSGKADGLYSYSGAVWASEYAVSADRWRFSQHRQIVVGVHGGAPVAYDLTAGTAGLLGGTPPNAKYTATANEFTFLAGDPAEVREVTWSAFGNPESWTADLNQSGAYDIADGSAITGLAGGEFCLVFQRQAIHRLQYTGGDAVWQRDKISSEIGCLAPGSLVQVGRMSFFLSERGFMKCDGSDVQPIGVERVDQTFFDTHGRELDAMYAAVDPRRYLVQWIMPGNPGYVWTYHWVLDRWSVYRLPVAAAFTAFTSSTTTDAISGDVDSIDLPVDSPVYAGGEPRIYYVDATGVLGTLTGAALEAYLETPANEIAAGRYARPYMARPFTDAVAGMTLDLDARRRLGDAEGITSKSELRASGDMPVRSNGRVFRCGLTIAAGTSWNFVQALTVDYGDGGTR